MCYGLFVLLLCEVLLVCWFDCCCLVFGFVLLCGWLMSLVVDAIFGVAGVLGDLATGLFGWMLWLVMVLLCLLWLVV